MCFSLGPWCLKLSLNPKPYREAKLGSTCRDLQNFYINHKTKTPVFRGLVDSYLSCQNSGYCDRIMFPANLVYTVKPHGETSSQTIKGWTIA